MTKPLMTQDEAATSRFEMIARLISDDLDKGIRHDLMREIAQSNEVSERTLRRYVAAWKENGFEGLKPKAGWERPDSRLPRSFQEIVDEAVTLRRESPSRSVADIIRILELEGKIAEGSVARSTLQRHLAAKGYSASQVRMYTKKGAAARRYMKSHRNMLWQSDIKYGPFVPDKDGRKRQIFLVCWIDDATRFIVSARFYPDQTVSAIEDSLRRAVQKHGVPDAIFVDNGKQYRSKWLKETCAKLGVRLLTTRPYHPEAKGAIERLNRTVSSFISEAAMKSPSSVEEYNDLLRLWIDGHYHKRQHSALGGISPQAAFGTDVRPLRFLSAGALRDAFLHTEERKVDKTGCISFEGSLYEVGLPCIGSRIVIRFDPSWTDEVEVIHDCLPPFMAKKLVIGENCGTKPALPDTMKGLTPETSRLLDGLEKKSGENLSGPEIATTFKDYWGGDDDV